MTITTAERPVIGAGLPGVLKLAPMALAAMLLSNECRADWQFKPTFALRESYTDNVALERAELARNEFITEATPGFNFTTSGPRLNLSASGQWSAFAYSDKDAPNVQDSTRRYQMNGRAMVIDDLFYVDASANGQRQAISAFGQVRDNPYSSLNNTELRTWRVSPYLQHRFGSTATATLRFTRDSVQGDTTGFGNSTASATQADVASGPQFSTLGWNLSYYRQELSNAIAGDSKTENVNLGLRYRVIPRFSLTASVGYDDYEYPALDERTAGRSVTAGFAWTPSARTSVEASFGHRYFGKTGALQATHRTRLSTWELSYTDQVTTNRSQFILPASIDTAAMLDGLFAASFPDPVQRQQVIAAYMAATGLPATLGDSVNYLSNRYTRTKRLAGGAIFRGARSSLSLSVFQDQRTALSLQQSDSALLGSQLAGLNDDVRQRGGSATVDYRLSSRSSAYASAYLMRAQSLSTDFTNNNRQFRLGMTRRISGKAAGTIELRHARGSIGSTGGDTYHENALVATLSVQY
ncbi:TIGR03016 family PEP-CTERM system-associated outer membrane protein [Massilia sp. TN1-12]|uniref:TIGR03016 family PEP-CTERM system-associated outer membrane protein n=1 Tax=Massilia paldalensis TaxID=3377675 RepID=UPI00384AD40C